MKQVVIVAVVSLGVGAAVASFMQRPREPAVGPERSPAQQAELTRRLDRLEQMLAAAPAGPVPAPQQLAPPRAPPLGAVASGKEAARVEESPEKHAEQLQTANTMVDQAIQTGHWSMAEMAALAAASGELSLQERDQLMSRLTMAINSNQVHMDMRRRPTQ